MRFSLLAICVEFALKSNVHWLSANCACVSVVPRKAKITCISLLYHNSMRKNNVKHIN